MDSREHRRVRMRLTVRLRWSTPFGQKTESCETMDVSRRGLLVSAKEPHAPGAFLWVTFPYDASLSDGQPEILARVVRCGEALEAIRATNAREKVQTKDASERERAAKLDQLVRVLGIADAAATYAVAIHFEMHARTSGNGNIHHHEPERRGGARRALAVPVRVRPENVPWFEEAMTIDFSAQGMRFRSHREYKPGDHVNVIFQDAAFAPWPGKGEFRSRVVRVAPVPDSAALDISVCRADS